MNERKAMLSAEFLRKRSRFSDCLTGENDLCAASFRVSHLVVRRADRHDDSRRNAKTRCVIGHSLGVIASRYRNHSSLAFRRAKRKQFQQSATLFETAGCLHVFIFDENTRASERGKLRRLDSGSSQNSVAEKVRGGSDIGNADFLVRPELRSRNCHTLATFDGLEGVNRMRA